MRAQGSVKGGGELNTRLSGAESLNAASSCSCWAQHVASDSQRCILDKHGQVVCVASTVLN